MSIRLGLIRLPIVIILMESSRKSPRKRGPGFLGLGKLMLNGASRKIVNKQDYIFFKITEKKKIGYLGYYDYKKLFDFVNRFRGISCDEIRLNLDLDIYLTEYLFKHLLEKLTRVFRKRK